MVRTSRVPSVTENIDSESKLMKTRKKKIQDGRHGHDRSVSASASPRTPTGRLLPDLPTPKSNLSHDVDRTDSVNKQEEDVSFPHRLSHDNPSTEEVYCPALTCWKKISEDEKTCLL